MVAHSEVGRICDRPQDDPTAEMRQRAREVPIWEASDRAPGGSRHSETAGFRPTGSQGLIPGDNALHTSNPLVETETALNRSHAMPGTAILGSKRQFTHPDQPRSFHLSTPTTHRGTTQM
jgi:hypothetical protein